MRYTILLLLLFRLFTVEAQFWVRHNYTPDELVREQFVRERSGVKILNVKYSGAKHSIAYFLNNTPAFSIKNGLLLSTGFAQSVGGRNTNGAMGAKMHTAGDRDLNRLVHSKTNDAAVLIIEFESYTETIEFDYFFGSEEYPEYIDKGVNDVFAFFIRKIGDEEYQNIAHLPDGTPVTVDNINDKKNSKYYISNKIYGKNHKSEASDFASKCRTMEFAFDGFTTLLTAVANVEPFIPYELKIAIADVGDDLYDSGVFLRNGSFQSSNFQKKAIHDIEYRIQKMMNIPNGDVQTKVNRDTLKVISHIEFEFNQHAVSKTYYSFLDSIAAVINDFDDMILSIEGHTDAMGTVKYNDNLSYKRALFIADYLVGKGVMRSQMNCQGFGSRCPVVNEDSEEARSKNRRVEFKIYQRTSK